MEITEKIIKQIRALIQDMDEDAPLFSNEELEEIGASAETKNHFLYIAYIQKAGKLINEENSIKKIDAGNEKIEHLSAVELSELCYKQAQMYYKLWQEEKRKDEENWFLY